MNIENSIENYYQELLSYSIENKEYLSLYQDIENNQLREILITLHFELTSSFRQMNERLPTSDEGNHFWADPSRRLIKTINICLGLYNTLKETSLAIEIDEYYFELIQKCRDFLSTSGGSNIPPNMDKIILYYKMPIFTPKNIITTFLPPTTIAYSLKLIGSGSYANVYKYKDTFYDKFFVLKRAKKDLSDKEIERFQREYEEMKKLSSPYIIEVYYFDKEKTEYVMEFMDYTLDEFITKNNGVIPLQLRKNIVNQIFRSFEYLHSKNILHRDINPKNILVKKFDDIVVVKLADFGLVKMPDSHLTTVNSDFKGYFNDPSLITEGFGSYKIQHETFALTRLIFYVMTGKTNTDSIQNQQLKIFVNKGLNPDKTKRFQNISEMKEAFRIINFIN